MSSIDELIAAVSGVDQERVKEAYREGWRVGLRVRPEVVNDCPRAEGCVFAFGHVGLCRTRDAALALPVEEPTP